MIITINITGDSETRASECLGKILSLRDEENKPRNANVDDITDYLKQHLSITIQTQERDENPPIPTPLDFS